MCRTKAKGPYIVCFSLLAFVVSCSVPMYEPVGLGLPTSYSTVQVMSAVASGVRLGGWEIVESRGLNLVAKLTNYDEEARVRIDYEPRIGVVSFRYLNSENMQYSQTSSGAQISFSYNLKLEEMEKAIAMKLAEVIVANSPG